MTEVLEGKITVKYVLLAEENDGLGLQWFECQTCGQTMFFNGLHIHAGTHKANLIVIDILSRPKRKSPEEWAKEELEAVCGQVCWSDSPDLQRYDKLRHGHSHHQCVEKHKPGTEHEALHTCRCGVHWQQPQPGETLPAIWMETAKSSTKEAHA